MLNRSAVFFNKSRACSRPAAMTVLDGPGVRGKAIGNDNQNGRLRP
jgi:hypothetical protein